MVQPNRQDNQPCYNWCLASGSRLNNSTTIVTLFEPQLVKTSLLYLPWQLVLLAIPMLHMCGTRENVTESTSETGALAKKM